MPTANCTYYDPDFHCYTVTGGDFVRHLTRVFNDAKMTYIVRLEQNDAYALRRSVSAEYRLLSDLKYFRHANIAFNAMRRMRVV